MNLTPTEIMALSPACRAELMRRAADALLNFYEDQGTDSLRDREA